MAPSWKLQEEKDREEKPCTGRHITRRPMSPRLPAGSTIDTGCETAPSPAPRAVVVRVVWPKRECRQRPRHQRKYRPGHLSFRDRLDYKLRRPRTGNGRGGPDRNDARSLAARLARLEIFFALVTHGGATVILRYSEGSAPAVS